MIGKEMKEENKVGRKTSNSPAGSQGSQKYQGFGQSQGNVQQHGGISNIQLAIRTELFEHGVFP